MQRKNSKWIYGLAFLLPVGLMLIIFALLGIHPFGTKSILIWDLNIQYVEFFTYLKKIFTGEASAVYSFSKSIGGSMIATIGYYLTSPFNILVLFFKQEQMQSCIFLITVLKIGMCGLTSSIFFKHRFNKLNEIGILTLSCAYALMQYTVTQMSNIMWLDGVYMLPLLLLAVWYYITHKKRLFLFIAVAVGIAINWYIGYMNCLFIPFYFIYEWSVKELREIGSIKIRKGLKAFLHFCLIEGLGALGSAFLLLPVIIGLRQGKGIFELSIFYPQTNGSLLDILRGYVIGNGLDTEICLYCGSLVLIGVIVYFVTKEIPKEEKYLSAALLGLMVGSCFFKPLENVWNGFRYVYSYFYRFNYIVILVLILLCAKAMVEIKDRQYKSYPRIIGVIIISLLIMDQMKAFSAIKLWAEIFILVCILVITKCKWKHQVKQIALMLVLITELAANGFLATQEQYWREETSYTEYVEAQKQQIEAVNDYDNSQFYRMEQTLNREFNNTKTTAYFNECLSYGYMGVTQYTSGFDQATIDFIRKMGYSDSTDKSCYDEPILAADSLLGIKYLLSDVSYDGWKTVDGIEVKNGKQVYYNPYAISAGVKVTGELDSQEIDESNPFIYQNKLYSQILGKNVEIYKEVPYDMEITDSGLKVSTSISETDGIVYGYGRFGVTELKVLINGEYRCDYQKWLSYLVFNVGDASESATIEFQGVTNTDQINEVQFYYLDMNEFETCIRELKEKQADVVEISDGYVALKSEGKAEEQLLLTIPYDTGWTITVNGIEVEYECAFGALIELDLEEGENDIVMNYHLQGLKQGIALALLSILLFGGYCMIMKRLKM